MYVRAARSVRVRISPDLFKVKMMKQQQKQQEQNPFKVSGKCHKDKQQMEMYLLKKMN